MNDGSALVIFLVLQKIVEGQQVTVGGVSHAANPTVPTVCYTACLADCWSAESAQTPRGAWLQLS
jgi:hypothetical protein